MVSIGKLKLRAEKSPKESSKVGFPFTGTPMPSTWKEIERYPLNAPFAYAVVGEGPTTSTRKC